MNASLLQLPIIMILKMGTPPRYIAIAAPDLIECITTSCFLMRSFVSIIATILSCKACSMILLVMWDIQFADQTADTGVVGNAPIYLLICLTIAAHWMTGQRMSLPVFHWVIVSSSCPFFCMTKVSATLLAELREVLDECGILLLAL
jgi:hypothetical protein